MADRANYAVDLLATMATAGDARADGAGRTDAGGRVRSLSSARAFADLVRRQRERRLADALVDAARRSGDAGAIREARRLRRDLLARRADTSNRAANRGANRVWVDPHTRANGARVDGHWRLNPNPALPLDRHIPTLADPRPPRPAREPAILSSYTPNLQDRVRSFLTRIRMNPRTVESLTALVPWTPMGAAYDAGRVIGEGVATDSPGLMAAGAGLTALAALPIGPARRVRLPRRRVLPIIEQDTGQYRLPLPLGGTQAERMAGLGFVPGWWHETGRRNVPGIMHWGFDARYNPLDRSAGATDVWMPLGTFVKPTDAALGVVAPGRGGPTQVPLAIRVRNPIAFDNREALERYLQGVPPLNRAINETHVFLEGGSEALQRRYEDLVVRVAAANPGAADREILMHAARLIQPFERELETAYLREVNAVRQRITEHLRTRGHDGLHLRADVASDGRVVETMVVFDAHNLRRMSRRTRFDPMDSASANLLASITAASLVLPNRRDRDNGRDADRAGR